MANDARTGVFDISNKNLKLDTEQDIAPYISQLEKIEPLYEIHLSGNTFGVGACQALAEVLKKKKSTQNRRHVRYFHRPAYYRDS